MKMGEGVEWAIHCVSILAALPEDGALPGKSLAEFHGVSESYLLKHLKALVRTDILESIPGPKGGYRLARPADDITFLDIVEAIEGQTPAFRCTEIRMRGPVNPPRADCLVPCAVHAIMNEAEEAWKNSLRRQTIGSLSRHLAETLSPTLRIETAAWMREKIR